MGSPSKRKRSFSGCIGSDRLLTKAAGSALVLLTLLTAVHHLLPSFSLENYQATRSRRTTTAGDAHATARQYHRGKNSPVSTTLEEDGTNSTTNQLLRFRPKQQHDNENAVSNQHRHDERDSIYNTTTAIRLASPPKPLQQQQQEQQQQEEQDEYKFIKHKIRDGLSLPTAQTESEIYRLGSLEGAFCVQWNVSSDAWWASKQGVEWEVFHEDHLHYCFRTFRSYSKRQFYKSMYRRQFESDCRTTLVKKMWSSGLGADISNVVDGLIHGAFTGRPFQLQRSWWHYACPKPCRIEHAVCKTADMNCYFLPLSSCPQPKGTTLKLPIDDTSNTTTTSTTNATTTTTTTRATHTIKIKIKDGFYQGNSFIDGSDPTKIFVETPHKWYLEYVMRPQTWLRKLVYDLATQYTIQQPCTVFHVRRGDVVLHDAWSRRYHAISEYLNVSDGNRTMEDNILLLTDDHNAIGEATTQFPDKHWMYLNRTRYRANEGGWEQQLPSHNAALEMTIILATFRLAGQCNSLVRSTSGFGNFLQGAILNSNASAWIANVEDVNPQTPLYSLDNAKTRNISKACDRKQPTLRQQQVAKQLVESQQ